VSGDPVYGAAGDLGLARQFLHAHRLRFAHPFTGEEVDVSSPLPADLEAALDRARR
jgi:23S rRNA pseudouridine1911/1915/1917 synthase